MDNVKYLQKKWFRIHHKDKAYINSVDFDVIKNLIKLKKIWIKFWKIDKKDIEIAKKANVESIQLVKKAWLKINRANIRYIVNLNIDDLKKIVKLKWNLVKIQPSDYKYLSDILKEDIDIIIKLVKRWIKVEISNYKFISKLKKYNIKKLLFLKDYLENLPLWQIEEKYYSVYKLKLKYIIKRRKNLQYENIKWNNFFNNQNYVTDTNLKLGFMYFIKELFGYNIDKLKINENYTVILHPIIKE